jgi:hypothetical protein
LLKKILKMLKIKYKNIPSTIPKIIQDPTSVVPKIIRDPTREVILNSRPNSDAADNFIQIFQSKIN